MIVRCGRAALNITNGIALPLWQALDNRATFLLVEDIIKILYPRLDGERPFVGFVPGVHVAAALAPPPDSDDSVSPPDDGADEDHRGDVVRLVCGSCNGGIDMGHEKDCKDRYGDSQEPKGRKRMGPAGNSHPMRAVRGRRVRLNGM